MQSSRLALASSQEIGVRVALGASAVSICAWCLTGGMRQAAIGRVLGLALAWGVTRVLTAILVGASPTDPLTPHDRGGSDFGLRDSGTPSHASGSGGRVAP